VRGLRTTGYDVRKVFMTSAKDIGTFTLGRNFGLFAFDCGGNLNDRTSPGSESRIESARRKYQYHPGALGSATVSVIHFEQIVLHHPGLRGI